MIKTRSKFVTAIEGRETVKNPFIARPCAAGRASVSVIPLLLSAAGLSWTAVAAAEEAASRSGVEEIVVTAQKREESINDIGMSVQAATGEKLTELGITDTSELYKVVSGFNSNVTYYGTEVYTIRGIGFQDTALASSPTVSVYLDEMPRQFAALTPGLTLDLQRVEVLKGPQGTLFGQNATGGAVNYIANKPTQEFEAGLTASYGTFETADLEGFVSGSLTETLGFRLAVRSIQSGDWQERYTDPSTQAPDPYWVGTELGERNYSFDDEAGERDFLTGRLLLQWDPSDKFSALATFSGFIDEGDTLRPQLAGIAPLSPPTDPTDTTGGLNPLVSEYPFAPSKAEAADWGPCVNVDGGTPANVRGFIDGFGAGTLQGEAGPDGQPLNLNNRLYENCEDAAKDNDYWSASLRMDYDLNESMTLTSLTSYNKFTRDQRLESDGTIYQDYESYQRGFLKAFFQEIRLAGVLQNGGNWVVGANYEDGSTWDTFLQTYGISTAVPTLGIPLGATNPNSRQETETWAAFANMEYPILDNVTLQAGIRYSDQKRDHRGCGSDGGDQSWAQISELIQIALGSTSPLLVGPGECATTGTAPDFNPVPEGFTSELDQDNVSWRLGANWAFAPGQLAYLNVSQGYKNGSFPTVATSALLQLEPATQEKLLAYELGGKFSLFQDTMQLNAATFYYDYTDKQVLGSIPDPFFGSLPAMINVPDSHVVGYDIGIEWYPMEGLRIAPSYSYAKSEVDGTFLSFDQFFIGGFNAELKNFSGQKFPNAPTSTANVDVQYEWSLGNDWIAYVGANWNYQDATKAFFYDDCRDATQICTRDIPTIQGDYTLEINERALLDLRAGVESPTGSWKVFAWGRNVTDKYYWNQAQHVNDVLLRFPGMPRMFGLTVSVRR